MRTKTIGLALTMAWAGQGCVIEANAHGSLNTTVATTTTTTTVFGASSAYAGSIEGTLYYLDAGTQRLPTNWSTLEPRGRIYTDRWDVGTRAFTEGFPGVSSRAEWFAIRYAGQFFVPTGGRHTFRLHASAGARLLIDGRMVVDNDGLHAAQSAVGSIDLTPGSHSIEVQYFQGPVANVALQVFVTPPGGREQIFVVQAPQGQVVQPPPPPPVVVQPPPPPPVVVQPPPPPPPVVVQPPPPARPPRPDRRPPVVQPQGPVVTPFGTTATFEGAFQGQIYRLPNGTARLPTNWAGLSVQGTVYADRWDLAPRPYTGPLPGASEQVDWFAVRYTGRVQIPVGGNYSFRIGCHDGARLLIDGRVVVDNDGRHDFRSAAGTVVLSPGFHDFEIQHFQGQRDIVGLQVFITPPNSTEQIFVTQPGGIVVSAPPPVVVPPRPQPQPQPQPPVVVPPRPQPQPPVVVPPQPQPPVVVPPQPQPPVVVPPTSAPFGTPVTFSGAFQGNIYFLPEDTQRLPTNWSALQPRGTIYADRWDIAQRQFSEGFPGVSDRFEWFAIRYTGQIAIAEAGTYAFRIESDDGAKLLIDGRVVVDNDGVHALQSQSGTVALAAGVHTVELQYFQGPRFEIALRVFVTPPSGTERIFVTQPGAIQAGGSGDGRDVPGRGRDDRGQGGGSDDDRGGGRDGADGRGPWNGRGPRTDSRDGGRGPREGRGPR